MFIVERISVGLIIGIFNKSRVELNYGTTCHKFQGRIISEPLNIHEVDQMSFEVLYSALTRAKILSDIQLDMTKLRKFYRSEYGRPLFRELNGILKVGSIYKVEDNGMV